MPSTINATSRRVRSGTVSQFSVGGLIGNLYISSAFGFICSISVVTVDERSNASAHLLLQICIRSGLDMSVAKTNCITYLRKVFRTCGVGMIASFKRANCSSCRTENAVCKECCSATFVLNYLCKTVEGYCKVLKRQTDQKTLQLRTDMSL